MIEQGDSFMLIENPVGTNGFEFLEFTTAQPQKLCDQFSSLGFHKIAHHHTQDATIFQQGDIRFIINMSPSEHTEEFRAAHGASVSAMGFKVKNAKAAFEHCMKLGANNYIPTNGNIMPEVPAIYGVGNSLIYFIDSHSPNYHKYFSYLPIPIKSESAGLTYIDHVTHNLFRGNMDEWADFYTRLFNFREIRYFDIEGKLTGLKSRAMTSPCGKIRIPLNESADDKSQIEEFLKEFNGEGIQHIALGTDNIYSSITTLRQNGIDFLDTPDTYYDLLSTRLPNHGEPVEKLKQNRILLDGDSEKKKLLLQIFTKNMLGPVFFEIIQRKGDDGFGEGNFRALFESIELDQIQRGVLSAEKADA